MNETTRSDRNPLAVEQGTKPTIMLLLGWFVVHTAVWIGLVKLLEGSDGVGYDDVGTAGTPWFRQFVIPLGVVFVLQVVGISRLGWWRSVLGDSSRTKRTWLAIFPIVVLLLGLTRLANDGFAGSAKAAYLVGCAVTVGLVGLTEEITFRGVELVGARRLFRREWMAVAFSAALFGLFHAPNIILGAEAGATMNQVVYTAVIGTGIYCLRRVTGWLWLCVVLHAVYDFMLIQGHWHTLF